MKFLQEKERGNLYFEPFRRTQKIQLQIFFEKRSVITIDLIATLVGLNFRKIIFRGSF